MKTILPRKIKQILDCCITDCHVMRFVKEVNNVGTQYVYIVVQDRKGAIFAAWNSLRLFTEADFHRFYSYEDAHRYLDNAICVGCCI